MFFDNFYYQEVDIKQNAYRRLTLCYLKKKQELK